MKASHPLTLLSPIHRATRRIGGLLEPACRRLGVQLVEGHVVSFLAVYGPVPVGRVREVFGLRGSTLTSLLDRLERKGLARRLPNPCDRRSIVVEALPRGVEVAAELRETIESLEAAVHRRIDDRDFAGFEAVIAVIDSLTDAQLEEERA